MEVKILEDKKNLFKIQIEGEDDTIFNPINEELNNMPSVDMSGYKMEHPLLKKAVFTVKGTDAKKSFLDALKKVKKTSDSFKKLLSSIK